VQSGNSAGMGRCGPIELEGLGNVRGLGQAVTGFACSGSPQTAAQDWETGHLPTCNLEFDGLASWSANGFRDYFKVLVWSAVPDAEAIKRSFRKTAVSFQMRGCEIPNDAALSKFKEISEAYEVLSDPESDANTSSSASTAATMVGVLRRRRPRLRNVDFGDLRATRTHSSTDLLRRFVVNGQCRLLRLRPAASLLRALSRRRIPSVLRWAADAHPPGQPWMPKPRSTSASPASTACERGFWRF